MFLVLLYRQRKGGVCARQPVPDSPPTTRRESCVYTRAHIRNGRGNYTKKKVSNSQIPSSQTRAPEDERLASFFSARGREITPSTQLSPPDRLKEGEEELPSSLREDPDYPCRQAGEQLVHEPLHQLEYLVEQVPQRDEQAGQADEQGAEPQGAEDGAEPERVDDVVERARDLEDDVGDEAVEGQALAGRERGGGGRGGPLAERDGLQGIDLGRRAVDGGGDGREVRADRVRGRGALLERGEGGD